MKSFLFDSLFRSESCAISSSFVKVLFMAFYSGKLEEWGGSQATWDLLYTNLCATKLSFHSFWSPRCMRIIGVCVRIS